MTKQETLANEIGDSLRNLASEVETTPLVRKIDWGAFLSALVEMLPLILAFFQAEDNDDS